MMTHIRLTDGVWLGRVGGLYLRWSGADVARAEVDNGALTLDIDLRPGQAHDLVLELSEHPLDDEPVDPDRAWTATEAAWRDTMPALDDVLSPSDARRSYAVLRGLTSRSGGMVAAATTSLPERAEAGRNYDYRYVWIRDQCYAGHAAAVAGCPQLLADATRFVSERLLEHGDQLAPAYTTTGDPVPSIRHLSLPGYPGGFDIVGNHVNKQFQLDAFGESLVLFAAAAERDDARRPGLAGRRSGCRSDREAVDRARRGDLGDRAPGLDAQPPERRRRAAVHGRGALRRAVVPLVDSGRRHCGRHVSQRPAPEWSLAARTR